MTYFYLKDLHLYNARESSLSFKEVQTYHDLFVKISMSGLYMFMNLENYICDRELSMYCPKKLDFYVVRRNTFVG